MTDRIWLLMIALASLASGWFCFWWGFDRGRLNLARYVVAAMKAKLAPESYKTVMATMGVEDDAN